MHLLTSDVYCVYYRGYIAPEYFTRGEISRKSDIFSLGVLILEIVTGLKVSSNSEDISSNKLVENVRQKYSI
jgi:serine/threonine protein kinase